MSSKQSKLTQINLWRGVLVVVSVIVFVVWMFSHGKTTATEVNPSNVVNNAQNAETVIPQVLTKLLPLKYTNGDVENKDFVIKFISTEMMETVNTVYVIPGGGSADDDGYPEWTKRRVIAAYNHFEKGSNKDKSLFIALSAGSLNTRNVLLNDGRIMFESQHIVNHLVSKGVPKNIVFGDIFSWDSVTNAYSLRMFLEGVLLYRGLDDSSSEAKKLEKLKVEVFISDFHAERIKESFRFMLGLQPSLLDSVQLNVNIVDSLGIAWKSEEDFRQRVKHEEVSIARLKETAQQVKTVAQYHAFVMLGGHLGIQRYLHSEYEKSSGGGW